MVVIVRAMVIIGHYIFGSRGSQSGLRLITQGLTTAVTGGCTPCLE